MILIIIIMIIIIIIIIIIVIVFFSKVIFTLERLIKEGSYIFVLSYF